MSRGLAAVAPGAGCRVEVFSRLATLPPKKVEMEKVEQVETVKQ